MIHHYELAHFPTVSRFPIVALSYLISGRSEADSRAMHQHLSTLASRRAIDAEHLSPAF